jgi:hypothetical protein
MDFTEALNPFQEFYNYNLELYWWLNIFWLVQKAKGCQDEMV